jgi:hypothetical protein
MLDLNRLIPPGSGWELTNAININDRGEILAKAAPEGFTPNDDADLGHLALLIPCKEDDWNCENRIERPESLFGQGMLCPATVSGAAQRTLLRRGGLDSGDDRTNTEKVASSESGIS